MKLRRLFIALVRGYRVSGFRKKMLCECNFEPSCSSYSLEAFGKYGSVKGMFLTLKRLARCNDRDAVGKTQDPLP